MPVPPPKPPRRRTIFFRTLWTAAGLAVGVLLYKGVLFAIGAITDVAEEASASLTDTSGTVLSESWSVDGVDVVYVESGGTPCENYCWEWLLTTQPDCATAIVTVEIADTAFGDAQRQIEQSVAISGVTSVLVEAAADDGDYADIISIACP